MTDLRSLIAETLATHVDVLNRSWNVLCLCDTWGRPVTNETLPEVMGEHRLHRADALLAALDGRLLPEGGESAEEWRVAGYSARSGNFVAVLALPETAEEALAEASTGWSVLGYDARPEVRTETSWPDGSRFHGPWRPVADALTQKEPG